MAQEDIVTLLLLISPILIVQLGVVIYALLDLRKRKKVKGDRWVWGLILILGAFSLPAGLILAAVYLFWGRHPDEPVDSWMEDRQ